MNTFKRITTNVVTALTLSTAFFAHNVQAAPSDAVCVSMGKLGGIVVDLKKLGTSEEKSIAENYKDLGKSKVWGSVVKMINYIYVDDGKYVDAKYLYLKCTAGHFD